MTRLSQLIGRPAVPDGRRSLQRHADGARLEPDRDGRGLLLWRHRGGLAPSRVLEVAEGGDHPDELRVRLKLASVRPSLGGPQVVLLPPNQLRTQRLRLALEDGE